MTVSPWATATAGAAIAAFGAGEAHVERLIDEESGAEVHVLTVADAPVAGSTTLSTVSLHQVVNLVGGRDRRIELAAVARRDPMASAGMLAFAAMGVVNHDRWMAPGDITRELYLTYTGVRSLPHVLWLPSPWPDLLEAPVGLDLTVTWLMAMPISEAECRHAEAAGAVSLAAELARSGADPSVDDRPSVL